MPDSVPIKNGRRLTERRKLQNREAQRKYRQKIKSRLEVLEREVAQKTQGNGASPKQPLEDDDGPFHESNVISQFPAAVSPHPILSGPLALTTDIDSGLMPGPRILDPDLLPTTFNENFSDIWDLNQNESFRDFSFESSLGLDTSINTINDSEFINSASPKTADLDWSPTVPTPSSTSQNDQLATIGQNYFIMPFDQTLLGKSPKASYFKMPSRPPALPFPKPLSGRNSSEEEAQLASALIGQLRLDNTPETRSLIKTSIARGHNIRDVLLAGLGVLGNPSISSSKLSNPHINTLTLLKTSTLQAYLTIARSMSIHIPDLYLHDCPSPFHKPDLAAKGADFQTLAISYHFSNIPPNLHPTSAQILHPHHPWLDLIPFPTLRERAITLSAMNPPLIEVNDLKNDIFMNDGLFCWRNSKREGGMQPWEMRSWEAELWFLKKWWILLGGEEADVWQQTQWWRSMKGEEGVDFNELSRKI
ncbi:hypothetical protein G7Y89_g421 [Cudoniella acicularis]|uniref:BZIP domain-containing protein n=1 Tax=Cudoniella acicularis TaxID=354080 RepID=A0A8H4RY64_9HELO|nr:hypothetical protein G7Y89_g421 [Cudoniella acicularis]